jgi:hypothetical protein
VCASGRNKLAAQRVCHSTKPDPLLGYISAYPSSWRPDQAHLQITIASDPPRIKVATALTHCASVSPPLQPVAPLRHLRSNPPCLRSSVPPCRPSSDPARLHVAAAPTRHASASPLLQPGAPPCRHRSNPPLPRVATALIQSFSTKGLSVDKKC